MKNVLSVIFIIYISLGPFFYRVGLSQPGSAEPDDFSGVFVLQDKSPLRVSIESGWERMGEIPVVLTFGYLEVSLEVNADELANAESIETVVCEQLDERMNFSFFIYEQNPLRTRMKLLDKRQPVQLIIDPGGKYGVEAFVGSSRLKMVPIRVTFAEEVPGELYQLRFEGPNVDTHRRFIFMPSRGVIYAAPFNNDRFKVDSIPTRNTEWAVWAVKVEPEEEQLIKQGEIR